MRPRLLRWPLASIIFCASMGLACLPARLGRGEEPRTIVEGLNNPCGLAIQPDTGHVFLAESGAGRVLRWIDGKTEPVIVGLPVDALQDGPKIKVGPLGMAFLDEKTLLIGSGGHPHRNAVIYVAQVPEPGAAPLHLDSLQTIGPLPASDQNGAAGDFFGVAATKSMLYATALADDGAWIVQADINSSSDSSPSHTFGELDRFIATKPTVNAAFPTAIVISQRGEIVVGDMGSVGSSRDSVLTFYRATDGKRLLNLQTDRYDIIALAYGPPQTPSKKLRLYALDFAWEAHQPGGLFRLDSDFQRGKLSVRSTRIATFDKPSSMAFAPDESLFVTVLGTQKSGSEMPAGKLLHFKPNL